ncbi:hypothetical protein [Amorphus sp. MBR-141]
MELIERSIRACLPRDVDFVIYSSAGANKPRVVLMSKDRRRYIGREADSVDKAVEAAATAYQRGEK